jgi:hypothetical protein
MAAAKRLSPEQSLKIAGGSRGGIDPLWSLRCLVVVCPARRLLLSEVLGVRDQGAQELDVVEVGAHARIPTDFPVCVPCLDQNVSSKDLLTGWQRVQPHALQGSAGRHSLRIVVGHREG